MKESPNLFDNSFIICYNIITIKKGEFVRLIVIIPAVVVTILVVWATVKLIAQIGGAIAGLS